MRSRDPSVMLMSPPPAQAPESPAKGPSSAPKLGGEISTNPSVAAAQINRMRFCVFTARDMTPSSFTRLALNTDLGAEQFRSTTGSTLNQIRRGRSGGRFC